jgi:DNA-binding MarR family transcriptional regulator
MRTDNLELVIANLFSLFPLFRKKFMKPESCAEYSDLSHTHFHIMITLSEFGMLPVSEIGKKLMISRPNMTPLLDKLILEGLIQRLPDEKDRRIININLTGNGRELLEKLQKAMVNNFRQMLSRLSDEDLEQLVASFEKIKHIFSKIKE